MPPPLDIVKVAIEWPGANAQLIEIDQKRPLASIIKEVCDGWSLPNSEYYAFRYADGPQLYITEQTRSDIKNGTILRLAVSPSRAARQLLERIQSSSMDARLDAMKELAKLSADATFATEFINMEGVSILTRLVESGTKLLSHYSEMLAFTLTAFLELMDHAIVSWDMVSITFIKQIAGYVSQPTVDVSILQRSLAILESMVLNSQALYQKIAEEITVGQLISHLQVSNQEIQTYAIALINALFLKAPEDKRQEMANAFAQKHLRSIILNHIIRGNRPIKTEMAHQLYVLQVLTFNLLEERMMTKMDPSDQAQRDIIFELRRIAFDADSDSNSVAGGGTEKRKAMYTKDYKMLGFTNHVNPALDFTQTPPGMLALDNMLYMAKYHQDTYTRIVLENSSREDKHECPFGRSAIELTKMLCEILQVGELPNEGRNDYHPMFFTHDRAFEEFFYICIQLLNKTWKEMRATAEDFNKVMQVVKEQITRALPSKPNSLDQFKSKLRSLSYSEILRLRQSERMSQDDFQSPPIVELREKIQPEVMELIKQQRLNRLCEGTSFRKIGNRRRQERFWYCRLALNHKVLHYGDLEDNPQGEVAFESLQEKIPVADIKAVVTGKDCPHMKEKSALKQNKEVLELAFSILYDPDETLNFIAPNKYENFHFPLFMTLVHMAMIFVMSTLSRVVMRCCSKRSRVVLSWTEYLKRVAPTALATALDIGLSNWSFLYITVSLYTMTKSTCVLFILFFSLLFKLEELRAVLILVVLLIASGLFMFTYESTQFNVEGFLLVLAASFLGGIRWTLTQILMQKAELGLQNPIDAMYHLQPLMFLGLFPLFLTIEGLHVSTSEKLFGYSNPGLLLSLLGTLSLGGFLAFGLGFSEFLLVSKTSSLTLSIAGIFKELCTLQLATHLMGDEMSVLNWLGFAICISGIALHVFLKALRSKGEQGPRLYRGTGSDPDLELLLRTSKPGEGEEEEEDGRGVDDNVVTHQQS